MWELVRAHYSDLVGTTRISILGRSRVMHDEAVAILRHVAGGGFGGLVRLVLVGGTRGVVLLAWDFEGVVMAGFVGWPRGWAAWWGHGEIGWEFDGCGVGLRYVWEAFIVSTSEPSAVHAVSILSFDSSVYLPQFVRSIIVHPFHLTLS